MPYTKVQVANLALELLGAQPMLSFTETTASGAVIRTQFAEALKVCLSKAFWRFSVKQVNLPTADAVKPVNEFKNAYTVPADFQRVWRLFPYHASVLYRYQSGKLLTEIPLVGYAYQSNELVDAEDTHASLYSWEDFDASTNILFIEYFRYELASRCAMRLNPSKEMELKQLAERARLTALGFLSLEESPDMAMFHRQEAVRRGRGGRDAYLLSTVRFNPPDEWI